MNTGIVDGSLTGQIRALLKNAREPVSIQTICTALALAADQRKQAGKNLYNMRERGEVELTIVDGKSHYAIVDGFQLRQRKALDAPSTKPATTKPAKEPASEPKAPRGDTVALFPNSSDRLVQDDPATFVRPGVLLKKESDSPPAPQPARRSDFELSKRIDVIRDDIDEALGDAIAHGHAKELLMQLHLALGAMNRAGRAYPSGAA